MSWRQRLRRALLVGLKYTLNPLTRRLARASVGPFSLLQHVGRRSGKRYETPLIVSRVADGFVIELTYGPNVDWHKNVVAAGRCTLLWRGAAYQLTRIEPISTAAGLAAFPPSQRLILRLLRRTHFEKLALERGPRSYP